jgi:ParB/RepB/Spo0J family partition protein
MDATKLGELAESMGAIGLQQPVILRECSTGYEIVAGHRRLLAARMLDWANIRAIVYPEDWRDADAAMIHENVVREELNPAHEAILYAQLIETRGLDEAALCALVKRSPDYIASRVGLLRGSRDVMEAVRSGEIALAVASILNKFPDDSMRRYYLDAAIRAGTSAKVVRQWLDLYNAQGAQITSAQYQEGVARVAEAHTEPTSIQCFLCGGARDPWNLISVMIHKWEVAQIEAVMSRKEQEAIEAKEAGAAARESDGKQSKVN